MINQDKPNVGTPETYLNVGDGFQLLVGGLFRLITGALGTGGMTNIIRPSQGETWGTVASTWVTEDETWLGISQLINNSTKPNSYNYTVENITYSPVTLTGGAIVVSTPGDGFSYPMIDLPFSFKFFGNYYTTIVFTAMGYVSFWLREPLEYTPASIPTGHPSPRIFGCWGSYDLGGTIKYETFGTSGNRRYVIEYRDFPEYLSTSYLTTFQIILYESDYHIEIHTTKLESPLTSDTRTQGIESFDGINYAYIPGRNNAYYTLTNDAISFVPISTVSNLAKP